MAAPIFLAVPEFSLLNSMDSSDMKAQKYCRLIVAESASVSLAISNKHNINYKLDMNTFNYSDWQANKESLIFRYL